MRRLYFFLPCLLYFLKDSNKDHFYGIHVYWFYYQYLHRWYWKSKNICHTYSFTYAKFSCFHTSNVILTHCLVLTNESNKSFRYYESKENQKEKEIIDCSFKWTFFYLFPQHFRRASDQAATPKNMKWGFKKCSMHTLSFARNIFQDHNFLCVYVAAYPYLSLVPPVHSVERNRLYFWIQI